MIDEKGSVGIFSPASFEPEGSSFPRVDGQVLNLC